MSMVYDSQVGLAFLTSGVREYCVKSSSSKWEIKKKLERREELMKGVNCVDSYISSLVVERKFRQTTISQDKIP